MTFSNSCLNIDWGSVGQWAAALATFSAVMVALFRESVLLWWRRPSFDVTIRPKPPDCNKSQVRLSVGIVSAYYFRLWVKNTGRSTASRVQVFAAELQQQHADGTFHVVPRFLPMNLLWTHTAEVFADGIAPEMGQHCELGIVFPPNVVDPSIIRPSQLQSGKTYFQLETQVRPFTGSSSLEPGTYRLRIMVAASNAKPRIFTVTISILGDWYDDEAQMLSKGVGVTIGKI
jgi:hypothetical protein